MALPDNQHALSGSSDNTVKLFNVNDGAVLRTFKHHTRLGVLPGAAARRPPLRQRLVRRTARIAYHGFEFEPDPAWVDAEKKAKAKAASSSRRGGAEAVRMSIGELKAEVRRRGLDAWGCVEKGDLASSASMSVLCVSQAKI